MRPICICSLLILLTTNFPSSSCDGYETLYLLKPRNSDLVLDGGGNRLKLKKFDGFSSQLWRLQCDRRPNLFYIFNNYEKTVLDFDQVGGYVFLGRKDAKTLKQQWFVGWNERIGNAAFNVSLDENLVLGNFGNLGADYHGNGTQRFVFESFEF